MEAETKVRLLFVCPCGINVSGSPIDAKADVQIHRENCRTCAGINYVNTLQIFGRRSLQREHVIPADQMNITMNMLILFGGVIPPGYIVQRAITDANLPENENQPGMRVLPDW